AAALATAALLGATPARAQSPGGIALNQLDPTPAGDTFFAVPSPFASGHLVPRAFAMFDYAASPLTVSTGATTSSVVSSQGFLHIGASLALFDRLLLSAALPVAVVQSGDSPTIDGVTLASPSSAAVGDLRLGARVRMLGEDDTPFQIGLGAYLFAPTAPSDTFTGEGALRLEPHLAVGGRFPRFVWSASIGAMLRGSDNPSVLTYGAGAALSLFDDRLQVGPEVFASTPLQEGFLQVSESKLISRGRATNAELLLDVRGRLVGGLWIGAAAGPGLSSAIGTPVFRALGTLGWSPPAAHRAQVDEKPTSDTDEDGILDIKDACPVAFGPASADPKRNGCPAQDRDEDGIADLDDACPDERGNDSNPARRGCPPDQDGDSVPDAVDVCPTEKGSALENGCPAKVEAPTSAVAAPAGPATPASPATAGPATPGSFKLVRVSAEEITLLDQVKFRISKSDPAPIDPASEPLLTEVRDALAQHPELVKLEVQAHTDSDGNAKFNETLSTARAESVKKWLVDHGVASGRLVAKGYGASKPIADNKTVAGRAKNRRMQIVVIEKK
ncbi:MAG: OmpA family protein, partial [Byssovorax sp.]